MEKHSQQSEAQELSDLLDVAERIQSSYEASRSRASAGDFIEIILAILALAAFAGALLLPSWGVLVGLVSGGLLLGYTAMFDKGIQRIRRRSETDRQALQEVLDLLREIEGIAAMEGTWSRLQRAEFRIRLSRFEIEEPRTLREALRRRVQI